LKKYSGPRTAAWLLFVVALVLPAIDSRFGEALAGYGTRGYQCFVGLFVVVLAHPAAAPLWILLILGNFSVLLLPWAPRLVAARPTLGRWWRWVATLAVLGSGTLAALGGPVGIRKLHVGFYVWAFSLGLAALALWLPASGTYDSGGGGSRDGGGAR